MSGLKFSAIQIEEEKKACQETLRNITTFLVSINTLKEEINKILGEIPDGVKKSFSSELQTVENWLKNDIPKYNESMNSNQLKKILADLQKINREGIEALSILIEIKEQKRTEKARELIKKKEMLKTEITAIKELTDKWMTGEGGKITNTLDELPSKIEAGEFIEVENLLNHLQDKINQLKQECTSLEYKDNQRYYVLSALKTACRKMGWEEITEPALEEENNPQSPLVYEVETFIAGRMKFRLTLDHINVDSPLSAANNSCYKDFDKLSEEMKQWGVITKFERVITSEEDPKLIQKGEMDLPDDENELENHG